MNPVHQGLHHRGVRVPARAGMNRSFMPANLIRFAWAILAVNSAENRRRLGLCQSALKIDPGSALKIDPPPGVCVGPRIGQGG